ncbi:NAD-P-binding protein [Mycena maculata]|uniref:NAD-P-binding protein n=1 Tax=Mycena maculata TaxID=230809 RepID=A0AAD7MP94_9AGAR|nr:NAD-P-binding protein [Mycena maculata]
MASAIPRTAKALILRKSPAGRSPSYHDVALVEQPIPTLKPGELLVEMSAAAFNHRDLRIRKGMVPRIAIGSTLGSNSAGKVIAAADSTDPLLGKRVFLTPMRGWESDPNGPAFCSKSNIPPLGTFAEYVVVERTEALPTPSHLTDKQAAAWPIAGLTAWRYQLIHDYLKRPSSLHRKGNIWPCARRSRPKRPHHGHRRRHRACRLQLCVAMGASVYVTSGSAEEIGKAVKLGTKGGVSYKDDTWPALLGALLKKDTPTRPTLDAVIDSSGAEIMGKTSAYLKHAGKVVCYGMTVAPTISITMREVMRHQQLLGLSASRAGLTAPTAFLAEHKIVPIVSTVLEGLEEAERGFEMMRSGEQFGKIVIRIAAENAKARL